MKVGDLGKIFCGDILMFLFYGLTLVINFFLYGSKNTYVISYFFKCLVHNVFQIIFFIFDINKLKPLKITKII